MPALRSSTLCGGRCRPPALRRAPAVRKGGSAFKDAPLDRGDDDVVDLGGSLLLVSAVRADAVATGAFSAQHGFIAVPEVPRLRGARLLPQGDPMTATWGAHGERLADDAPEVSAQGGLNGGKIVIRPRRRVFQEGGPAEGFADGAALSVRLPQITAGESPLPSRVKDLLVTATCTGSAAGYVTAQPFFDDAGLPCGVDFYLHRFCGSAEEYGISFALAYLTVVD